MPTTLFKLAISASTITVPHPSFSKFFRQYSSTTDRTSDTKITIIVDNFIDDAGEAATTLPTLDSNNGYYTLSINGILQQTGMFTVTPGGTGTGKLEITVTKAEGDAINENTPIVLIANNIAPASTTTVNT